MYLFPHIISMCTMITLQIVHHDNAQVVNDMTKTLVNVSVNQSNVSLMKDLMKKRVVVS